MSAQPHCSPSRSSLSCCQIDHTSHDDVHGVAIAAKDRDFFEEKHSFPKRPEVDLTFCNIRYVVSEWSIYNLKPKYNEILHGVSGEFKAGQLVAIMGPSGAGKSTLLNVLAAYTVKGVKGKVLVNGKVRVPYSERWKRTSCYIQQESLMRTKITVGEAMTLTAHLKLGYAISSAYKHTQVLQLLEILGLSHCYDTLCGKLSGGQKKRLDIALELLSNPSVLFLDEPTTGVLVNVTHGEGNRVVISGERADHETGTAGHAYRQRPTFLVKYFTKIDLELIWNKYTSNVHRLDSSSCSQCIALLARLAKMERRTVICTIHQPSALILEMFDAIYAVADGRCIYKGPVKSLLPHMSSIGIDCPPYHNPADFLLEVAIGDYGISVDKLAAAVDTISQDDKSTTCTMRPQLEETGEEPPLPAGFIAQCYLLYKRQLLCLKRDHTLLVVRLLCHLLIGVIFGYLYMGSGYRANGVLANYVYLYGSLLLVVYTGKMAVTLAFPVEMRILSREHFNRWYRLAPYYISMLLVEIPFQASCVATYLGVSYWLTGQPVETPRIISFVVFSIASSLTAQAWGFFIGATTPVRIAVFAGPIIAVLFSVFGFCIRYMDTPIIFRWMFHISYFRAGFHSLLHTVYGFGRLDLKCDDFYCHYKKPTQFLKEMDIVDTSVANNLILIVGIGVLMHLLTASALWCKLNRR